MTFLDQARNLVRAAHDPQRVSALAAFETLGVPSTTDEVWRYAPLGDLGLERFEMANGPTPPSASVARDLAERAALVIRVHNGHLVEVRGTCEGVEVALRLAQSDDRYAHDAFAQLAFALSPGVLEITIAPGTVLDAPLVVDSSVGPGASFPLLRVLAGARSSVSLVEHLSSADGSFVVPVAEYVLDESAALRVGTYQHLERDAWHLGRSLATVGRDATMRQAVISLGAHYNRSRNDADLVGTGASNELRTTFLGRGDQVHDYRTRQFHRAPRTTSVLLSKGAVAGESRSVYTGLIEIEKGAKKTDARQTNHNLLLSPHAHADSVPNLDIRENDVVCAHASSVGPLDELQLWYLESRGVPRADAERLMIQGFLYEMVTALPVSIAEVIETTLARELVAVVEAR
jgi:Fe-S cluster assembly protein SufD